MGLRVIVSPCQQVLFPLHDNIVFGAAKFSTCNKRHCVGEICSAGIFQFTMFDLPHASEQVINDPDHARYLTSRDNCEVRVLRLVVATLFKLQSILPSDVKNVSVLVPKNSCLLAFTSEKCHRTVAPQSNLFITVDCLKTIRQDSGRITKSNSTCVLLIL
ncbi:hypothetical protein WG66_015758 [Moniliophthora roreri]|nr:hypothetical protein WG66_015758 [Moniliophthora roreri]